LHSWLRRCWYRRSLRCCLCLYRCLCGSNIPIASLRRLPCRLRIRTRLLQCPRRKHLLQYATRRRRRRRGLLRLRRRNNFFHNLLHHLRRRSLLPRLRLRTRSLRRSRLRRLRRYCLRRRRSRLRRRRLDRHLLNALLLPRRRRRLRTRLPQATRTHPVSLHLCDHFLRPSALLDRFGGCSCVHGGQLGVQNTLVAMGMEELSGWG